MQRIEELTSSYFRKHELHRFCIVEVNAKSLPLFLFFITYNFLLTTRESFGRQAYFESGL